MQHLSLPTLSGPGHGRHLVSALGSAAGDGAAAAVGWIKTAHLGVASRWFSGLGPVALPARLAHDALASAAYGAIAAGLRAGGRGAGVVAAISPLAGSSAWSSREMNAILGAANGLWGDHLDRLHPALALPMTVRSGGTDVRLTRRSLRATYPAGGRRLAIFVHGLCETEDSWGRPAEDDDSPGTYGDRLRRELGMAPIFIRYNSGLPLPENAELFAHLVKDLVGAWPDEVVEVALVGHSMGGLVLRAAADLASAQGMRWPGLLRHCVYLGTPHDGAPLARGVAGLSRLLRRLPETAAVADILDVRSAGIRDLEVGYAPESPSTMARHHVVGATLGPGPRDRLSRTLGDLLVTPDSAVGRGRNGTTLGISDADRRELSGLSHFQLLDHPDVAEALRDWLRPPST